MSHFAQKIFQYYKTGLIIALPSTTCLGFSAGLVENFSSKSYERKSTALEVFTTMIGFSTLGVATGLAYPLTFPAIMYDVLTNQN
jgi:hypothetical protein